MSLIFLFFFVTVDWLELLQEWLEMLANSRKLQIHEPIMHEQQANINSSEFEFELNREEVSYSEREQKYNSCYIIRFVERVRDAIFNPIGFYYWMHILNQTFSLFLAFQTISNRSLI